MRYFAQIGSRELEVDVSDTPDGLQAELNGEKYLIDAAAVEAGTKYSVLIGQRSFAVSVDGNGGKLSLVINGFAYHVDVEDERERAVREVSGGSGSSGGVVESVMPGIVRKVEVEAGMTVAVGDRLLILEAMKMENEICAETEGIVDKVHVTDGQTVESGEPLVTLKAADE